MIVICDVQDEDATSCGILNVNSDKLALDLLYQARGQKRKSWENSDFYFTWH
jgi:hypothetical protein